MPKDSNRLPNQLISKAEPIKILVSDIIEAGVLDKIDAPFSFAVGIRGNLSPVFASLEEQGSCIVGGTAGTGKTTFIHSMIACLAHRASPAELRFVIASLQSNEYQVYNQLPHLLCPTIKTSEEVADLLAWAVNEMTHRYALFSQLKVQTLKEYNNLLSNNDASVLPRIVIVIDEMKYIMDHNAKDTEEAMCRIGHMGESAGIHLVLSTQYADPSVITRRMKAAIPTRIAFRTASEYESRVVLDDTGAEELDRPGDLLYRCSDSPQTVKLRGYYSNPTEPASTRSALYCPDCTKPLKDGGCDGLLAGDIIENDIFCAAVDLVLKRGTATVPLLQRELKLNYSMAVLLMDQMEKRGIVGPFYGDVPRAVLITESVWKKMQKK